jgi:hypothetical protein
MSVRVLVNCGRNKTSRYFKISMLPTSTHLMEAQAQLFNGDFDGCKNIH